MARGDADKVSMDTIVEGLGERWLYPDTIFKPYPSGSMTHSPMDAVATLMRKHNIQHQDIEQIECTMPPGSVATVCEPREVRIHPRTPYHMKFSLPYSVAILAVLGHADVDDYSDRTLSDRRIANLASCVHCVADSTMPQAGFPARVVITTRGQQRFEMMVAAQRGSRANPMSADEHRSKFRTNANPSLGIHQTERLLATIESLWGADGLHSLAQLVFTAPPRSDLAQ
jgi:2-methylcitrate dehydratase PrpD